MQFAFHRGRDVLKKFLYCRDLCRVGSFWGNSNSGGTLNRTSPHFGQASDLWLHIRAFILFFLSNIGTGVFGIMYVLCVL